MKNIHVRRVVLLSTCAFAALAFNTLAATPVAAQFICGVSATGADPQTGAGATATGNAQSVNLACGPETHANGTDAFNTAIGSSADASCASSRNVVIGRDANAFGTSSSNIAVGFG